MQYLYLLFFVLASDVLTLLCLARCVHDHCFLDPSSGAGANAGNLTEDLFGFAVELFTISGLLTWK